MIFFANNALADPGGGPGGPGPPPPTPRFGGPSVQFKSKTMNFRALILYFFKKIFSLALLGINFISISHSSCLTLLIISYIYFISLCTYFYTIWTQPITFLVCKD